MYGLLLESIAFHIRNDYGEDVWQEVMKRLGLQNIVFSTHRVYPDGLIGDISNECSIILKKSSDEFKEYFGKCFVKFFANYDFEPLIRASGRYFRDFVHGIDDLHNRIRFGFPGMISPFFHVDKEDRSGMILHYRSSRKGFSSYVIGQLKAIARDVYKIEMTAYVTVEPAYEVDSGLTLVVLRLDFDNSEYFLRIEREKTTKMPAISLGYFFKVVPFAMLFDRLMTITAAGNEIQAMFNGKDNIIGKKVNDLLVVRRPRVKFVFQQILLLEEACFELQSKYPVYRLSRCSRFTQPVKPDKMENLLLKGQMKFIKEKDSIIFLCSPLLSDVDTMIDLGLGIQDLSIFGFSRDIVTTRMQHGAVIESTYDKLLKQTKELDENLHQLEEWKKQGDTLLYSMIPKSLVDELNKGVKPISLAKNFDDVTVLFAEITDYLDMTLKSSPSDVVKGINNVFKVFDTVLDRHRVFKVETVVLAVYLLIGGAPEVCEDHADNVSSVALDLIEEIKKSKLKIGESDVQTRIGMHSGPLATGVVGLKNLRFCIFGDTVNTAARMQSLSTPGKILLTQCCHRKIQKFITKENKICDVKGKGQMMTYWLEGRKD